MALKDYPKLASGFYEFIKGLLDWHEPLNKNFESISDLLKSVFTQLDNMANGTTAVGNASKLGGETLDQFMRISGSKTFEATAGAPEGWYRILTYSHHMNILLLISESRFAESETLIWVGRKYASANSPTLTVLGKDNFNSKDKINTPNV